MLGAEHVFSLTEEIESSLQCIAKKNQYLFILKFRKIFWIKRNRCIDDR